MSARAYFGKADKVYPKSIIILSKKCLMPDGKEYQKVYAHFWNSVLHETKIDADVNKITSKDWLWCAFDKKDNCPFHITGDNVIDFIEQPNEIDMLDTFVIV